LTGSLQATHNGTACVTVATKYDEPRAHSVRERYVGTFGGPELPVPVESIAEDLLGLEVDERWDLDCSGMLLPAERRIVLNGNERVVGRNDPPLRRFRFTIAHEIGHWVCHCLDGRAAAMEPAYCRPVDLTNAACALHDSRRVHRLTASRIGACSPGTRSPLAREVRARELARFDDPREVAEERPCLLGWHGFSFVCFLDNRLDKKREALRLRSLERAMSCTLPRISCFPA
jgi:hypothetical protein